MKTHLVALSLLTLAVAAVPAASADQIYCGEHTSMCCAADDDVVGDAFIRTCMVVDHTAGASGSLTDILLGLVDCAVNGNC